MQWMKQTYLYQRGLFFFNKPCCHFFVFAFSQRNFRWIGTNDHCQHDTCLSRKWCSDIEYMKTIRIREPFLKNASREKICSRASKFSNLKQFYGNCENKELLESCKIGFIEFLCALVS